MLFARRKRAFQFIDFVPAADGGLSLRPPNLADLDDLLRALQDPLALKDHASAARMTRAQWTHLIANAPGGHSAGPPPAYLFWLHSDNPGLTNSIVGTVSLRISDTLETHRHFGHVGYNVFPPARGRHYAERAVRLLLPLANLHNQRTLWFTCNPENAASRRTIERLGGQYVETVELPADHILRARGETGKMRFRLNVP